MYYYYPAYTKGRPTFSQRNPTAGAYLIYHGGRVQYVGSSSYNVVKTAYRHFQRWYDPIQYRATFPRTAKILFFPTRTAKRARQIEAQLFTKYFPEKNINTPPAVVVDNTPDPF